MDIPFNKTKVMIFDFDGTLADSMGFLEDLAVKVLKRNLPSYDEDKLRQNYINTTGLPFCEQVDMFLSEVSQNKREKIVSEFEKEKKASILDQPLFPDVEDILQYLSKKQYEICVSSSSLKPIIIEYFEQRGLLKHILIVCGYKKGFEKGKDHFNFIQKNTNVSEEEMLFVGDSLKDKERAKISNIPFIGKIGMFYHEDFNSDGDCLTISNLLELKKFY